MLIAAFALAFSGAAAEAPRPPAEIVAEAPASDWRALDPENTLYIDLEDGGRVVVELLPALAPEHVAQVKTLAREGYYDGLDFYRVIDGFVAQGGDTNADDPKTRKSLGSAKPQLTAEFDAPVTDDPPFTPLGDADGFAAETGFVKGFPAARDAAAKREWLVHCYGAFAFGRNDGADTASTEFYVTLAPQRYLDRNLSVFGAVRQGMQYLQGLPRGDAAGGIISEPEKRAKFTIRVAADVPQAERTPLQVMKTTSASFRELIEARRNRPEAFFKFRPDHTDVCAVGVPVRPEE